MLKIALCDDDPKELNDIKNHIKKLADYEEISLACYSNGTDLICDFQAGRQYELVFLDIVMPGLNGIETATEIRNLNQVVEIVFLTTSPEYAIDSYSVDALDYILKPICEKSFERAISKYKARHKESNPKELIIQEQHRLTKIPLHNLCYVEVQDHNIFYHMADSTILQFRQRLADVEPTLTSYECFVKAHRSYIVNLNYVSKIDHNSITMSNGKNVLLSRTKLKSVSDRFLKHKFTKGLF